MFCFMFASMLLVLFYLLFIHHFSRSSGRAEHFKFNRKRPNRVLASLAVDPWPLVQVYKYSALCSASRVSHSPLAMAGYVDSVMQNDYSATSAQTIPFVINAYV